MKLRNYLPIFWSDFDSLKLLFALMETLWSNHRKTHMIIFDTRCFFWLIIKQYVMLTTCSQMLIFIGPAASMMEETLQIALPKRTIRVSFIFFCDFLLFFVDKFRRQIINYVCYVDFLGWFCTVVKWYLCLRVFSNIMLPNLCSNTPSEKFQLRLQDRSEIRPAGSYTSGVSCKQT